MSDSTSEAPAERNGVPTEKMFGTIAKLKEDGDLAAFRFSAKNEWVEGTASTSTIYEWYGAGSDQVHVEEFSYTADHPTLGHGHGPTPQEYVLHALAACITAGIATGAAARRIDLESVSSTVSADIDVRGVLGIDPEVRKGFSNVRVDFDVRADADQDTIDALVASATKFSAVFDMLSNPTDVEINVSRCPAGGSAVDLGVPVPSSGRLRFGRFDVTVGVAGEAAAGRSVMRIVAVPRPASELRALVVVERLHDLVARVHHERAVLDDGFADRATLHHEQLDVTVGRREHERLLRIDDRAGRSGDARTAHCATS